MAAHLSFREREEFTRRLKQSLTKVGLNPSSPTQLFKAFLVESGSLPISMSTVHKWLLGDALPDSKNMEIVARVCKVCPHWLRTGAQVEMSDRENKNSSDTTLPSW
jgi:hypothetical protein